MQMGRAETGQGGTRMTACSPARSWDIFATPQAQCWTAPSASLGTSRSWVGGASPALILMPCMPCIDYMLGSGHGRVYRTAVVYPPPAGRTGLFGTVPFPNWRGPGTDYKTVLDPLLQTAVWVRHCGDLHEQNSCSCSCLA